MSNWTDTQRTVLRVGLAALAVTPVSIGFWATAAPRNFYGTFPGGGRHWVSGYPPYNEHLLRDFASANLGFLVLLVFAAVVLERRLVQAALLAYAVAAIPHLAYHAATTNHLATVDNVLSLAGLAFNAIAPLALLAMTLKAPAAEPAAPAPAAT
jgi:hypothetical protein